jgi:hypothetical protein
MTERIVEGVVGIDGVGDAGDVADTRGMPGTDCPDCGAVATVVAWICDLCLADLGERRGQRGRGIEPADAGAGTLRFSDVMEELHTVVRLAGSTEDGALVAAAGVRAERLLGSLRTQFLRDLGLTHVGPAGAE